MHFIISKLICGVIVVSETEMLHRRVRDGLLLDTYGALLTGKQRLACEMVLLGDFSLAEAAEVLNVSRQSVHDLITRAREHMEETEKSLGILKKEEDKKKAKVLLENNRDKIPQDLYDDLTRLLT